MSSADAEMLQRMLEGDEDAFTSLYRERQGRVYRFALQMTGSAAIAEDVTQETFLVLLTMGTRYDPARGTVAAFLYGIARKLVLRRIERDSGWDSDDSMEEFAALDDILGDLTRREMIFHVRRAVL